MFSPLEKMQDRVMEKINEYLTLIVIYFYMLMCDSAYDSNHRSNIGFFHVFTTIFMLILNLLLILRNFGFDTLPDLYGKWQRLKSAFLNKRILDRWITE